MNKNTALLWISGETLESATYYYVALSLHLAALVTLQGLKLCVLYMYMCMYLVFTML